MSEVREAFETDWAAVEAFVTEIQTSKAGLGESVRSFIKKRLEQDEERVVITLSVLDSLAINCDRQTRDALSGSRWIKLLLQAFIANIEKVGHAEGWEC